MNKFKSTALKVKNHVAANKAAYAMGTVAITAIVLLEWNLKSFREFLTEKGIHPDEYFCPEALEELNN